MGSHIIERTLSRNEMIIDEVRISYSLYFVAHGVIKLFKTSTEGKEQIISLVLTGDIFNAMTVLDGEQFPMSAKAMGPTTLYIISKKDFNDLMDKYPTLSKNIVLIMVKRIRHLIALVEDLSFRGVISRVARVLLEHLSKHSTHPDTRFTQNDIAAMVGTAREVVARSLRYLEDSKLIEIKRPQIIILDKERLEQIIEFGV